MVLIKNKTYYIKGMKIMIEELADLNIKVIGIKFTPKFIKISALPIYTRSKKQFLFQISRELNEHLVNELEVGQSYRITQERIIKGKNVDYRWIQVLLLTNFGQQKGHNIDGLFE